MTEKLNSVTFKIEEGYLDKIKEISEKNDQSVDDILRLCVIEGLRSIYGPIKL